MICPEPIAGLGLAVMTSVSRAPTNVVTVVETVFELTVPVPSVVCAVAVLITDPSSRSACEIVRVPVQTLVAPGAMGDVSAQVTVALSSVIDGEDKLTLPLFVRV